jgi:hypothetical protein
LTIQIPLALSGASEARDAIDAAYFVIRVLRNAGRGYSKTPVSTEPPIEARHLAEEAIAEIEAREGSVIPQLDPERIRDYIAVLEEWLRMTYLRNIGSDGEAAASILEEMRSARDS